jgi:hypothetical protein
VEFLGFILVQILFAVAASVVGVICAVIVWGVTRNVQRNRRSAVVLAFLFPILTTFYLEAGLIGYGIVRHLLGKDSFVDGIYHYPLVNGYRVVIFDKMPEMATVEHGNGELDVSEVRSIEVSGGLIIVQAHRGKDASDWGRDKPANSYFVIDSATGRQTEYPSLDRLERAMNEQGVRLHPMSIDELLADAAGPGVVGCVVFLLLIIPAALAAVLLIRRLQHLRRESLTACRV